MNIMTLAIFKKLVHNEGDLQQTNLSLSGFSGEPAEAQEIISKELTIGSKTVPTAFFVVDVKGQYNILLGRDSIHANECVPSTLHRCIVQWVGDQVETVEADEEACVTMVESQIDLQDGSMECLSGQDLSKYDYISVGKDGFIPISVKPMTSSTRLANSML
jgi:hypothetical protein